VTCGPPRHLRKDLRSNGAPRESVSGWSRSALSARRLHDRPRSHARARRRSWPARPLGDLRLHRHLGASSEASSSSACRTVCPVAPGAIDPVHLRRQVGRRTLVLLAPCN
jgi:hypothetical protein